jgi:hypothetical protein
MLGFQNCTAAAPASELSEDASTTSYEALYLSSSETIILINESAQLTAYGGTPPYTYALEAGSGTVDPNTGLFTAPSYATTSQLSATDAEGVIAYFTISIQESTSSSETDATVATCGISQHSSSQFCVGGKDTSCSVTVDFSAQIPSDCRVSSVKVYANHFSGGAGSCSTPATFDFGSSTALGSGTLGNKTAYLQVATDLTTGNITLTSSAYGWGSCGGSPCNACVSNVSYELSLIPN